MIKKIIIINILFLIVLTLNVSALLNDSLVSYYNFEQGGATLTDLVNANSNGTNNGFTQNKSGIVGKAWLQNGSTTGRNNITISQSDIPYGNMNRTYILWVKDTDSTLVSDGKYWNQGSGTITRSHFSMLTYPSGHYFVLYNEDKAISGWNRNIGVWRMLSATYNSQTKNLTIYENNVSKSSSILLGDLNTTSSGFKYGFDNGLDLAPALNATLDEGMIWNRTLSSIEINDVYQAILSGCGYSNNTNFNCTTPPSNSIILNSVNPNNRSYTFSTTPKFDFNITSIIGTWNTSLIINGTKYGSNNTITTIGLKSITSTILNSNQEYMWWINATDSNNATRSEISEKRLLYIIGNTSNSCVQNLGNAYFRPNSCEVFP